MFKRSAILCLAMGMITFSAFSETPAQSNEKTNAINFNPLGLAFGNVNASYEHLFNQKHGGVVQIAYFFNGGYGVGFHYRHHFSTKPAHVGFNSPFWGPFIIFEQSHSTVKIPDEDDYGLDVTFMKAGLNIGRRWVWGAFNLAFRGGYGIPIIADFKWSPNDPEKVESIELLTKAIAGLDLELSIGFVF